MSHRQALDVLVMNYFKKLNLFPLYFAHINDENIFISAGLPGLPRLRVLGDLEKLGRWVRGALKMF